jgi:hypothetical protein
MSTRTNRTIEGPDGVERTYEIEFTVRPGCPATRFEPGEAPCAEIVAVRLDGQKVPAAEWEGLGLDPLDADLHNGLIETDADYAEALREDAAEARAEMRRESRDW